MGSPLVSCLCLTHNRALGHLGLLGEAIESFRCQDYQGPTELIILNDTPSQQLACVVPQVHVINLNRRFRTLGEKYAACTALARGEVLMWWDDDDISLPWRISKSVEVLVDHDYFDPGGYWFLDSNGLHYDHSLGPCLNCGAFTRDAYERAAVPNFGIDLDAQLARTFRHGHGFDCVFSPRNPDTWSYIYRWGPSPCHVSGWQGNTGYAEVGKREVVPGTFLINPRWEHDYPAMVKSVLKSVTP